MRRLLLPAYIFCLILFSVSNIYSAEKMRVAVLNLEGKGVSKADTSAISDIIRAEIVDTSKFIIVERSQINRILKEQEFQQTGCTDTACAVQLGKLLSTKKILIGEALAIGKKVVIVLRLVNVESGVNEFSAREEFDSIEECNSGISKIVDVLIEKIEEREDIAGRTLKGYYLRSIVPGWGQIYAGESNKGYIYMGSFILAGALSVYGHINFTKKRDAYYDLSKNAPQSEFDEKNEYYVWPVRGGE